LHFVVSLILACLFVFLAGFNVWNMLSGQGGNARSHRLWTRIHRACGYAFVALFGVLCYYMFLRIRGMEDEPSPRLILHVGLAVALGPLLFAKVIAARYQKAARGLLAALGITIFAAAFTLVILNLSRHVLRSASGKVSKTFSLTVVAGVVGWAGLGYFASGRSRRTESGKPGSTVRQSDVPEKPRDTGAVLNLTLARITPQSHDAKTLRFTFPQQQPAAARPGQFLTFEWRIDGRPVTRSYSVCSSPSQRGFVEITPKRVESGLVSVFLNDRASVGLTVKAHGPFGRFYFDESQHTRVALIAGGSGVTPLMAMLRYIDDLCLPVVVTLVYCVRTERDALFKDEYAALETRMPSFRFAMVLSQPDSEWAGWKGHLRREILEREVEKPEESTFFLCGPPAFMELARDLLREMAVEPSRILQESFGAAVAQGTQWTPGNGALEMKFSRSQAAFRVSPKETVLETSEKNGVLLPSGCRQGVCGTCATRLLSGKVSMENEEALSEQMRSEGFILPCVSRPLTDITLDA